MTWQTFGLMGAGLSVIGALFLVIVISPGRKRYENLTGAHIGSSPPMERYLKDQQRVGFVVFVGTAFQLLAALISNG